MAEANRNTDKTLPMPVLGVPLELPKNKDHDISVILRVILAISEDDANTIIGENEPYYLLVQRLAAYRKNIADVAQRIREVTGHA